MTDIDPVERLVLQHHQVLTALDEISTRPLGTDPASTDEATQALRTVSEVRALVQREPRITTPHCFPDHVTASALVTSHDLSHVLLHLHSKVGRWLQFGGHIEITDDGPATAAIRETGEESGLFVELWSPWPVAVDIHPATCGAQRHLDLQYAVKAVQLPPRGTVESLSQRWFNVAELPPSCDPSVRRLVARAVSWLAPTPSS